MPEGTDRGASARRPSARDAGEALLRVAHRLESLLAELAAEHGLTALEARTLRALLDGPSQGGLARQLGRAPPGCPCSPAGWRSAAWSPGSPPGATSGSARPARPRRACG
ncbi:hypothetical protein ACFQXA_18090 [Nocardiopsis composta]